MGAGGALNMAQKAPLLQRAREIPPKAGISFIPFILSVVTVLYNRVQSIDHSLLIRKTSSCILTEILV